MTLYNFFTEEVLETEADKLEELKAVLEELEARCNGVHLIQHKRFDGITSYQIIGQIHGIDTNAGDMDLLWIFANIKYVWFDSRNPKDNNIDALILKAERERIESRLYYTQITGNKLSTYQNLIELMKQKQIHSVIAAGKSPAEYSDHPDYDTYVVYDNGKVESYT